MWSDALPWIAGAAMSRTRDASPPASTDTGAATDDHRRVEQLFVALEGPLTNTLYRWLWDRDEVRDVVQEAFVRLWQMRARVDWDRATPLVYRIALNLASRRRRSRRRWRWVTFDAAPEPRTEPPAADAEQEAAVRRAIDALPERQRQVLVLSLHGELGYDQIARVLDIPVGTVASRRNTAVRALRAALERWERGR